MHCKQPNHSAIHRLFLLALATLVCTCARAQEDGCFGDTYVQVLRDEGGEDVRATCVIPYPGGSGDLLVAGTVGGNLFLTRIGRNGALRWRRQISTPSDATELSTVTEILVDEQGMIAGCGSTFNGQNAQRAYVFRYDPLTDALLYFRQPPYFSEATGLKTGGTGEYLLSGAKKGEPTPVFNVALLARIDRQTGLPVGGAQTFDLGGDEGFFDLRRLPDGSVFAGGQTAISGGAGATRASLTRLSPAGEAEWTLIGYAPTDINARLFTFDVEVVGSTVYVLSWGNTINITGSIGTSPVLSAFSLAGEPRWTRRYEIPEFEGEQALDLVPHEGGLLAYGFGLVAQRTPFLLSLDGQGGLRWARTYELPGTATLYLRGNQQFLADTSGIVALASYSGTGRPREGVLLDLDGAGRSDNPCLGVRDLEISVSTLNAVWTPVSLVAATEDAAWPSSPSQPVPENLAVYDDCDNPCDDCFERVFARRAVCRGERILLGGEPRGESGIYADTLPGPVAGCDSIFLTELAVSDGPAVEVTVRRSCGFATSDVQLAVSGGEFPYSYTWSTPLATGSRASLPAGSYQVTVDDALNCNPTVVDVVVNGAPAAGPDFRWDGPRCPGDSTGFIRLLPAGGGSIRILPDGAFTADRVDGLAPGPYAVVLRDSSGCEAFRQITIPPARPVQLRIEAPASIRLGDELSLSTRGAFGSFFSDYDWSAADTVTCADCPVATVRPSASGFVSVRAVTERGCPVSDSLFVRVTTGPARVFLPTGFSPNGDEVNDRLVPGLGPEVEDVTEWRIYDRWGNLVWEYVGGEDWWDGSGVAAGVYTYTFRARLIDGREERRYGSVTLVR